MSDDELSRAMRLHLVQVAPYMLEPGASERGDRHTCIVCDALHRKDELERVLTNLQTEVTKGQSA